MLFGRLQDELEAVLEHRVPDFMTCAIAMRLLQSVPETILKPCRKILDMLQQHLRLTFMAM